MWTAMPYPAPCPVNLEVAAHIRNKREAKRLRKPLPRRPWTKVHPKPETSPRTRVRCPAIAPRPNPFRRPLGASGTAS